MAKHVFYLALAISVGIAVSRLFGGTFNLSTLFSGTGTTTTNTLPCWLAAVAFDEDFETGPRVNKVRNWLVNDYEKSGPFARFMMKLYRKYGESAARVARHSPSLKRRVKFVFDDFLKKSEANQPIVA